MTLATQHNNLYTLFVPIPRYVDFLSELKVTEEITITDRNHVLIAKEIVMSFGTMCGSASQ